MNKIKLLTIGILTSVLFVNCEKKVGKTTPLPAPAAANFCDSITYNKHIKPIIINNCAKSGCHVSGFYKGDFTIFTELKVKVDNNLFKLRVFDSPTNPMPPTASGTLAQAQLDSIKCWLDKGALND
jgi:hypothetical protein